MKFRPGVLICELPVNGDIHLVPRALPCSDLRPKGRCVRNASDTFQRCWAHLLRETDDLAEHHSEAERIASMLPRLYQWVQDFLATDPSDEARERMRERALAYLEDIIDMDADSDDVQQFLGKLEGGLGH